MYDIRDYCNAWCITPIFACKCKMNFFCNLRFLPLCPRGNLWRINPHYNLFVYNPLVYNSIASKMCIPPWGYTPGITVLWIHHNTNCVHVAQEVIDIILLLGTHTVKSGGLHPQTIAPRNRSHPKSPIR